MAVLGSAVPREEGAAPGLHRARQGWSRQGHGLQGRGWHGHRSQVPEVPPGCISPCVGLASPSSVVMGMAVGATTTVLHPLLVPHPWGPLPAGFWSRDNVLSQRPLNSVGVQFGFSGCSTKAQRGAWKVWEESAGDVSVLASSTSAPGDVPGARAAAPVCRLGAGIPRSSSR